MITGSLPAGCLPALCPVVRFFGVVAVAGQVGDRPAKALSHLQPGCGWWDVYSRPFAAGAGGP